MKRYTHAPNGARGGVRVQHFAGQLRGIFDASKIFFPRPLLMLETVWFYYVEWLRGVCYLKPVYV